MTDDKKNLPTEAKPQGQLSETAAMFQSLVELAKDPNVDPAKMKSIVDMQMQMMDYQKREEYNRDKMAALMEMPSISQKGAIVGKNDRVQSRYAKFEDIHRIVTPILSRHHLAITFDVNQNGNQVTVTPILSHTNGHIERGGAMPLAVDTTGSKNATQGAGSAVSYGKRHTMKAMLNIVEGGEDDDGQGAGRVQMKLVADTEGWAKQLKTDAHKAAERGATAYREWFGVQTAMQRGYLVDEGIHETLKQMAERAGE